MTSAGANPLLALQKLRTQNEELRNELRQISSQLDEVLMKQQQQQITPPPENKEKKLRNAQTMLQTMEKEVEFLRAQAQSGSMEQKVKLEEDVAALQMKIKESQNRNREMQRQLNDNEKKIENLTSNPEEVKEIRLLNEELRVSKEKLRELKSRYEHDKKQGEAAAQKLQTLETTAREKGINLMQSPPKKSKKVSIDEDEPRLPPVESQDVVNLRSSLTELENNRKDIEARTKKRLNELETECKFYAESKEKTLKSLKEKEQECRIKEYEIKELKRSIRALRLKEGSLASAPDLLAESKEEESKVKVFKAEKKTKEKVASSIEAAKKKIEDFKEELKPQESIKDKKNKNREGEEEKREEKPSKKNKQDTYITADRDESPHSSVSSRKDSPSPNRAGRNKVESFESEKNRYK